jgi:glycosyltransferase involved in cell wall biosynthesis
MRITIFHSDFTEVGGAEILLTSQARWLMAAGHLVRIVALRADGSRWPAVLQGLPLQIVGLPAGVPKVEFLTSAMMPALAERARPFLQDADVVMAFNYPTAPLAALAVDGRRVWYACEPYRSLYLREGNPIAAAHAAQVGRAARDLATRQVARRLMRRGLRNTVLPWTMRGDAALREFDGRGVRSLQAVASLSKYGAACVRAATGRANPDVIFPMVRFGDAAAPRRGLRRSAPQVLVQTRLGIPKNIDTLLRGFALFRRTSPHAVLHVVGDGVRRKDFERIAARDLPGGVLFHGFLPAAELAVVSAQCDVFAFVPVDEPFGMVFPEAAARGLLLVGPDHGGPCEILEGGKLGAVVDACSVEALGDAMERAFRLDDADADRARERTAKACQARFGSEAIGRRLMELLGR